MAREERTVRGIPLWMLREYLERAGGTARDDAQVEGDGWRARLEQVEDYAIGSLRVGQVRLVLEGDAAALARVDADLAPRLLRAGG